MQLKLKKGLNSGQGFNFPHLSHLIFMTKNRFEKVQLI